MTYPLSVTIGSGVEGDEVADVDAEGGQVGGVAAGLVDPHLDVLPARGLQVDLVAVGVAAGHQRQHRAGVGAVGVVGQDRHPAALGEARAVRADGHDGEPPVGLEVADHAADGVGVGHHGPGALALAGQAGEQRAPPGDRQLDRQVGQLVAEQLHDRVGAPGRARGAQQAKEEVEHPGHVDLGERHGRQYLRRPRGGHTRWASVGRRVGSPAPGQRPRRGEQQVDEPLGGRLRLVVGEPGPLVGLDEHVVGARRRRHDQVEPGHGDVDGARRRRPRRRPGRGAARR